MQSQELQVVYNVLPLELELDNGFGVVVERSDSRGHAGSKGDPGQTGGEGECERLSFRS